MDPTLQGTAEAVLPFYRDAAVVTAIVGTLAALVALWGIYSQRLIASRRATLEFIRRQESDREILAARVMFITLAKNGIEPWAEEDKEKTEEAAAIRSILNEFEIISIGIQKGVYDYATYERWLKTSTITYWNRAAPYIERIRNRTGKKKLFHEFECLVMWLKDDKPPRSRLWFGRLF